MEDITVDVLICLGFALYTFVIGCALSTKIGKITISAAVAVGLGLLGMNLSVREKFAIFVDRPERIDIPINGSTYSFKEIYFGDPVLFNISLGLCVVAAAVLFVMSLHTIITCRRKMFPFLFRISGK